MIGRTFSHFRVVEQLGGGAMGLVYKAEDKRLGRFVALKFLSDRFAEDRRALKRFEQEARASSSLNHPNICTVHEIGEHEGKPFIVMEFLEGWTLRERLQQGPLEIEELLDFGFQVADGLAAAHSKRIIHRDLKPANIFVTREKRVKILDFGLAKLAEQPEATRLDSRQATERTTLTEPGSVVGTRAYMSPEQIRGRELDARSDLFSLGVILYEIATGARPFQGATAGILFSEILSKSPVPPVRLNPDVPEELEKVIVKALQKDRKVRYQTAADIAADLRRLQRDLSFQEASIPQKVKARAWWPRLTLTRAAFSFAVLLLSSLLVLTEVGRDSVGSWLSVVVFAPASHVAVLPFRNVGADPERQPICDGMVETLTSKLTQLQFEGSLWVVPLSDILEKGISSSTEARKHFGVNRVLEGSVQFFDQSVRLTLTLVDAKTARQLDSRLLDLPMDQVIPFQDSVVRAAAEMIGVELSPDIQRVLAAGSTQVAGAYQAFLEGRGRLARFDRRGNIDHAIRLFQSALSQDSAFSLARAALAEVFWLKYEDTRDAQWIEQAISECRRAVSESSELAQPHVVLGRIHRGTGRFEEAVKDYERALELERTSAEAYRGLAGAYEALGRLEEAEATYLHAIQLKSDDWNSHRELGRFYLRHDRHEEALEPFKRMIELASDNHQGYNNLGVAYHFLGRDEEAQKYFRQSLKVQTNYGAQSNLASLLFRQRRFEEAASLYQKVLEERPNEYPLWGHLAIATRLSGEEQKAQEYFRKAAELAEQQRIVNARDPFVLAHVANYYAETGQRSLALARLEEALGLPQPNVQIMLRAAETYELLGDRDRALAWIGSVLESGYPPEEINYLPTLDDLRNDPGFRSLQSKTN